MDEAAVHAVDGLAGSGPEWLFAIGALVIFAGVVIKVVPMVRDYKLKQLDIAQEREKRKADEARMRDERERENTAISARQVEAQERSTVAMNAMTAQMAVMDSRLEASQDRSRRMGERMEGMAEKVDEIHSEIVTKR